MHRFRGDGDWRISLTRRERIRAPTGSDVYGFAFVSHQVGGFLGVWLGGIVFEKFGSYTPIWWLAILFGVLSALINLPIVEKPVVRPVAHASLMLSCLSMISAQTRTAFVARENRFPLFRIML